MVDYVKLMCLDGLSTAFGSMDIVALKSRGNDEPSMGIRAWRDKGNPTV